MEQGPAGRWRALVFFKQLINLIVLKASALFFSNNKDN